LALNGTGGAGDASGGDIWARMKGLGGLGFQGQAAFFF